MHWQQSLLERLRTDPAVGAVRPYGSVLTPDQLDPWSDLDVELDLIADVDARTLLGGEPWAWQSTVDDGVQQVRLVLADGRRMDFVTRGATLELPPEPPDNSQRFDLALAATRFGRGADVIGLHLVLGVVREALVHSMILADQREGTVHHRFGSATDLAAAGSQTALSGALSPSLALRAADVYAESRAAVDEDYHSDWSGLVAVVAAGSRRP
ncbi:hypothetical protein [Curtobacterium sp. VKM Ac-2887]|uniref:hypothetical protein n=1 Tax=Curtobacterium sp. VKM Ac-2887 TaxID=2783819 RepID=UPI00188A337D|nr:hypothetical protein [Curtobacterium sp. VKM Ac-2887]MBF4588414.1 hypothetical protein [Curtobacterium sp. VKM Ac-2887]